jgi:dihydrofolate reductase
MGKLIYNFNVSLDGFIETPDRSLAWASVDEELHGWFNDRAREIKASLYGRRLYELMAGYWPTAESNPEASEVERAFARIWNATPRYVFSTTLDAVEWNSRLVRGDVAEVLDQVRREVDGDIDVGGANLAAQFIRRGLVDEYGLVVHPVILGGGTPFFPDLPHQLALELIEYHRFASGAIYLGYRATGGRAARPGE